MKDVLTEAMDVDGLMDVLGRIGDGAIRCVAVDTPVPSVVLARDPERQSVRVSRRCAARRATGARGGDAARRCRSPCSRRSAGSIRRRSPKSCERGLAGRARRRRPARRAADARRVPGVLRGAACRDGGGRGSRRSAQRSPRRSRSRSATGRTGSRPSARRRSASSSHGASARAALPDVDARPAESRPTRSSTLVAGLAAAHRSDDGTAELGWTARQLDRERRRRRAAAARGRRVRRCADRFRGQRRQPADRARHEWCERRLLARIHRLTLGALRREIAPVTAAEFMRWLLDVAARRARHAASPASAARSRCCGSCRASKRRPTRGSASCWRAASPATIRTMLDRLCLTGAGRLGPAVAASRDARSRTPTVGRAASSRRAWRRSPSSCATTPTGWRRGAARDGEASVAGLSRARARRRSQPAPASGRVVLRRHRPRHAASEGRSGNGAVGTGGRRARHRRRLRQPARAHRSASGAPAMARPAARGRVTAPAAGRCCTRPATGDRSRDASKRPAGCCSAATASSSASCSRARSILPTWRELLIDVPAARGSRRSARRTIRQRLHRRAVRAADRRRIAARGPTRAARAARPSRSRRPIR